MNYHTKKLLFLILCPYSSLVISILLRGLPLPFPRVPNVPVIVYLDLGSLSLWLFVLLYVQTFMWLCSRLFPFFFSTNGLSML